MNEWQTSNNSAEGIKHQARMLGEDVKAKTAEAAENISQAARDQAAEITATAKEVAEQASGRVEAAVNEQKRVGADYLGEFARSVERAADGFEENIPQAAHYIRKAADEIEHVATVVRDRNVRELVGEVQDFARRQPTIFFGGALLIGFAALRFFKSSTPETSDETKTFGHVSGAPLQPDSTPSSF